MTFQPVHNCAAKTWLAPTGLPTTVELETEETVAVPVKLENDADGKSWSDVCSGFATVSLGHEVVGTPSEFNPGKSTSERTYSVTHYVP